MADDRTIELEGPDGSVETYRLLGVFELEGREYALLMSLGDEDAAEPVPPSTALMRLVEQDGRAIFQSIESDDEFERVMAFIKDAAREMDADDA